jgi:hypothetical protein
MEFFRLGESFDVSTSLWLVSNETGNRGGAPGGGCSPILHKVSGSSGFSLLRRFVFLDVGLGTKPNKPAVSDKFDFEDSFEADRLRTPSDSFDLDLLNTGLFATVRGFRGGDWTVGCSVNQSVSKPNGGLIFEVLGFFDNIESWIKLCSVGPRLLLSKSLKTLASSVFVEVRGRAFAPKD